MITLFDGHGGSVASALTSSVVGPAVFERLTQVPDPTASASAAAASSSSLWSTVSWLVGGNGGTAALTGDEAVDGEEALKESLAAAETQCLATGQCDKCGTTAACRQVYASMIRARADACACMSFKISTAFLYIVSFHDIFFYSSTLRCFFSFLSFPFLLLFSFSFRVFDSIVKLSVDCGDCQGVRDIDDSSTRWLAKGACALFYPYRLTPRHMIKL